VSYASPLLPAQSCFANVSCATRLNARAAAVLSRRGAVMPQAHTEQHQPVKSPPSIQIKRLCIHLPSGGFPRTASSRWWARDGTGKPEELGTVALRREQSSMRPRQMQSNWQGSSGVSYPFQFGSNWSQFSRLTGSVMGQALVMEGIFSFFLESASSGSCILSFPTVQLRRGDHFLPIPRHVLTRRAFVRG